MSVCGCESTSECHQSTRSFKCLGLTYEPSNDMTASSSGGARCVLLLCHSFLRRRGDHWNQFEQYRLDFGTCTCRPVCVRLTPVVGCARDDGSDALYLCTHELCDRFVYVGLYRRLVSRWNLHSRPRTFRMFVETLTCPRYRLVRCQLHASLWDLVHDDHILRARSG